MEYLDIEKIVPVFQTFRPFEDREILRTLPADGTVFVKVGDKVAPADIIAETLISKGFRLFNVADILGVPADEVPKYLKKEIGAKVYKDEVLAERKQYLGAITRQFVVPCDGVLENLNGLNGQLTIRFLPERLRLVAGFYGEVTEIMDNRNIKIRTQVHVIKANMGVGTKREGVIKILTVFGGTVKAIDMDVDSAKKVIVAGGLISRDLIQKSIVLGVRGIIGGGMHVRDYRSLISSLNPQEDVGISILVLDGFGRFEIDEEVFETLKRYSNRHVIMDPQEKELIIPLSKDEWKSKSKHDREEPKMALLKEGLQVTVTSWPYFGKKGVVKRVDLEARELGSLIKSKTATVRIEGERDLIIPIHNLQIIS